MRNGSIFLLFTYLFYVRATDVPVGDDQVKHIELTRHLVNRFNNEYGVFFPKPKPLVGKPHTGYSTLFYFEPTWRAADK